MKRTTQLEAFKGMMAVQNEYVASGLTDAEFAEKHGVSRAQVTQWRMMLGIPNNAAPTRVSAAQVKELRECLKLVLAEADLDGVSVEKEALLARATAILEATK